jgi:peptidoglycan/xylan/chitin deacetylase (PgdA/CDA1 family)
MLAGLPHDQQKAEILQSKHEIEDLLGSPVTAFSYPYGSRGAYTETTMALVRSAGYGCACVGFAGAIRGGTEPYELPRCVVTDRDGEAFATWLQAIDAWLLIGQSGREQMSLPHKL